MAINRWQPGAGEVSQVTTLTLSGTGSGSGNLPVTINGKSVTVAVTNSATAAALAATLANALQGCQWPEFLEMNWTYPGTGAVITGTAQTPGVPVVIDAGTTVQGVTLTVATPTAATGPNDVNNAANWSLGAVPVDTDDIVFSGTDASALYNLSALSGVAPNSIVIDASFTGAIGLPRINSSGNGDYVEYRPRVLLFDGDPPVTVGQGAGNGSGRIYLSVGTGTCTVNVFKTGTRLDSSVPAFNLVNTGGASNVLNVSGGDVGVAAESGQTASLDTLRLPRGESIVNGSVPSVEIGSGCAIETVDQDGGNVVCHGTVTTSLGITSGYWEHWGTLPAAITCEGGTVSLRGTGTVTTATFRGSESRCECAADPRPRTFTDHSFTGGAVLNDPNKSVTFTNAGTWDAASLARSNLGSRFTLTRT